VPSTEPTGRRVQRSWLHRFGHHRWLSRLGQAAVPLDRRVSRATGGRVSVVRLLGLPSLLLTTTGRRSGQPRNQPLLYVPDGDSFVVVGSNWGGPRHPEWSANLLAQPLATATIRGRRIPVRAVLVEGVERDRLWTLFQETWPAYQGYAAHTDRQLRLFRLVPVGSATATTRGR
jgi:deazaflavin-dependent oxidoreductase (nitroreductase family)